MRVSFSHLSISTRLALSFGLSLFLLLSAFVIFLYTSFHVSLHHDFNQQLQQEEAKILDAIQVEDGRPVFNSDGALNGASYQVEGTGGTYVRLLTTDGAEIYRTDNFSPRASFPPLISEAEGGRSVAHSWNGAPVRSLYAPIAGPTSEGVGWVEITRFESALHHELHRLWWLLAVGVILGTAVAMAAGHRLARRALQPVTEITKAARDIPAQERGRRLPTEFGVQDELTELAETLNALLARIDASFERERRFRADAAHEMFTPLSAIQTEVDVALRRSRDDASYETALETVLRHSQRMSGIVEDLLELSRAESIRVSRVEPLDASETATHILSEFERRSAEKCLELRSSIAPGIRIPIHRGDLETVLSNLLDNAIKYTPENGCIDVSIHQVGRQAAIQVKDSGVGFSKETGNHLFDRFYRANAHGTGSRGTGLGLSIVQAVVHAYGGEMDAQSPGPGKGSTFRVTFNTEGRDPASFDVPTATTAAPRRS